jgi:hypothetical protein
MNEDKTEEKLLSEDFKIGKFVPKSPMHPDYSNELLNSEPKIDKELPLFIHEWINNGNNATLAYKKLHPGITDASARTLGSRKLAKVDIEAVLAGYGLTREVYLEKLKDGLNATIKNEKTGELEPDFKTRRTYHQALGKLLSLET